MSRGNRIQRSRVREVVKIVDSDGVLFRRMCVSVCRIQRRTYYVRAPQALWHIDGNHKHIRWRFVIHGGKDGYSREPGVFLTVNTNNKASTVLAAFKKGVSEWGLPEKVRSNKSGENVQIAEFMLTSRGRGSSITALEEVYITKELKGFGEKFWEDAAVCITNYSLKMRPPRTENFKTPIQLFIEGRAKDMITGEDQLSLTDYGIDYDVQNHADFEEVDAVDIPETVSVNADNVDFVAETENDSSWY